jgi:hypothetical protein
MQELKSQGFNELAKKIDQGHQYDKVVIDGVTYDISFVVYRSKDKSNTLEVSGKVDCITLFPFGDFRMGPSFELTVTQD